MTLKPSENISSDLDQLEGPNHKENLYDWLMQVPSGTRMLPVVTRAADSPVSVILTRSAGAMEWDRMETPEALPNGAPGLLVFLGLEKSEASTNRDPIWWVMSMNRCA